MTLRHLRGPLLVLLLAALLMAACLPGMGGGSADEPPPDEPEESEPEEPPDEEPAAPEPPEGPDPVEPNVNPPAPDESSDAGPEESDTGEADPETIELDDMEAEPPMNIVCTESTGCTVTEMDPENVKLVDPEAQDYQDLDLDTPYRMICIVGDSCYQVTDPDWTDEDAQHMASFEGVFTARSDASLAGTWQITNHADSFECANVTIDLPESFQTGVVDELDNGDLIGRGFGDETADIAELPFVKIAYGTYISHLEVPVEDGSGRFIYYLAMQSDDSFFGFFNAEFKSSAGDCEVTRTFEAMR